MRTWHHTSREQHNSVRRSATPVPTCAGHTAEGVTTGGDEWLEWPSWQHPGITPSIAILIRDDEDDVLHRNIGQHLHRRAAAAPTSLCERE